MVLASITVVSRRSLVRGMSFLELISFGAATRTTAERHQSGMPCEATVRRGKPVAKLIAVIALEMMGVLCSHRITKESVLPRTMWRGLIVAIRRIPICCNLLGSFTVREFSSRSSGELKAVEVVPVHNA